MSITSAFGGRYLATYREAMETYTAAMRDFRRQQRASRRAEGGGDVCDEPTRPILKRVIVGDITIEKLAGTLDDNPRGLLKHSDELATHFASFTRYKGQSGGSDEANWLSIFRADAIIYDRKTGEKTSVFVPHAAVSITGGIQPGVIRRQIGRGLFESGTVSRFVFRLAKRTPKEYVAEGIDEGLKERARASLAALYELEPDTDADGLTKPKVVNLSADARRRWKRFVNEWGERQFEADGDLAAALAKLEGIAARFALIRHLAEHGDEGEVSLASVEAGIRFADWAANEAVRVYRTLGESDDATETHKLVELVKRLAKKSPTGDRLTGRDLQRSRKERYPTVEAADAALDSLVSIGVGVDRYTQQLNTPVQGSGADGLKQALALLWERRAECPGAFPVLAVHDEIVVECAATEADRVTGWLKRCMVDGMAPFVDPVPVEVEATVGTTWGG